MGIDVETWRARIGLYHAVSVGRYLKKQQQTAQRRMTCWNLAGPGILNAVPGLFLSCFIVLMFVDFIFHLCKKYRIVRNISLHFITNGMKLCHEIVTTSAALSPQKSSLVALSLLLIVAGDVELNPGPREDLHVSLRNLMNALSSVESKWYKIGVQLSIPPCKLRTFEVDYHSCERRLSESLLFWLDGNTEIPVTWDSIVQVLRSPSVNENSLACQIQAEFCQLTSSNSSQDKSTHDSKEECNQQEANSSTVNATSACTEVSSQPSTGNQAKGFSKKATPPCHDQDHSVPGKTNDGNHSPNKQKVVAITQFQHLDEIIPLGERDRRLLEARLRYDSQEVMKKYYDLVTKFCKSLCVRNVLLPDLVFYLRRLKAYDPVEEEEPPKDCKTVFDGHMKQLKNATSIHDVFEVVEKYCSFFNYDIIKCMIEEHGTDADKLSLKQYIDEFDQYAQRRVYECPSSYTEGDNQAPELLVKLDSKYDECSLKALEHFQITLCKVFNVSLHALLLRRVDKGCIELRYQIPTFVQRTVFPLSTNQEGALSSLGVTSLSTGAYHFSIEEYHTHVHVQSHIMDDEQTIVEGINDEDTDSAIGGTAASVSIRGDSEFTEVCLFDSDVEEAGSGMSMDKGARDLRRAAQRGDLERVKTLVEIENISPLVTNKRGNNAIHLAAVGGSLEVFKYFVEAAFIPTCLGERGRTPLHWASYYGHLNVVKYLVSDQQVDPSCQDEKHWTALHAACQKGHLDVVRFLVAEMSKYMTTSDILNERSIGYGQAPLHIASQFGHLDIMKFLITEFNCDPNIATTNEYGKTPIHFAAANGHLHIVKYLIYEQECNPVTTDKLQDTPLHYACRHGQLEVVKFFIETLHCHTNVKGNLDLTPLQLACHRGHHSVVQYLQSLQ